MKKLFLLWVVCTFFSLNAVAQQENGAFASSESLFLSYEELPSKLYVGQVFPITLKAIVATPRAHSIDTAFEASKSAVVLNPNAQWESLGNSTFQATFYISLKTLTPHLPKITVSLVSNKTALESTSLVIPTPNVVSLKKEPFFSNVIAQNLSVLKYKTTTFDAKNAIIVLEIEANQANLKEFHLSGIPKNGVDSYSENGTTQKIFYYAIIPNYQKSFEFSYFDLPSNKFKKLSLPVTIENEEVSTQLGLNPKESIFEFYKNIAYGTLSVLFLLLFLRRRRVIYFIAMALFATLFFLDKNPLNQVELKSNSNVMILPTEHSTIFFTSKENVKVEKLAQRLHYSKILFPDGMIGWTNSENIIKP
jgi:hypothetical protein